ncbi:MAG: FGGY-family carbohydrate kinase [Clostridia bacterium]|nr:FGGY-family carbohydrate kinase [Clostridia bacterium]
MYVIAYDIGTTGLKACLITIEDKVELVAGEYATYGLYILENGGAEQDTEEWWQAMCKTTKALLEKTGVKASEIEGISFCSQMQGLVLVDKDGKALRKPMSYMDQRASEIMKKTENYGITVSDVNIKILLRSLLETRAASTSVKDPLWKYKWVQANEPEVYEKTYKWLDVKEYLICRLTGKFVMTPDSAYSTFLYKTQGGKAEWSKKLCKIYGVNYDHLPEVIPCTAVAGELLEGPASELGLVPGIKVYGSGGDATLIGVGAGATEIGETHLYWGTSGWVETVIDKQVVDINAMIAGIVGAEEDKYNYFAEMETAGKCFEWVKDHLVLDEINIYMEKHNITESKENEFESLYDYMSHVINEVEAGCNGIIFAPWLHGNRCPFEDPKSAGMFFNIQIDTKKREMLRAVIEGICFHLKWMLECQDKKIKTSDTIRFVGGGALSDVTCQILADITGRTVETVDNTKDAGAIGAAVLIAVGCGKLDNLGQAKDIIKLDKVYKPNLEHKDVYDRNYQVFKNLYKSNKKNFEMLNS